MIEPSVLDAVPLFRGVAAAARQEVARRSTLRSFAAGEVLWQAGGQARGVFVIVEGRVRVVRLCGGRQHVIHVEGAGGTLGEVPFFQGGPYPATAIASRRTTCLVAGRDALEAGMREDPALAFALLAGLAGRVRTLIGRLDGLVGMTVRARLAAVLLTRAPYGGGAFTLGATQQELAEELGTTREVLARALRELRDEGCIGAAGRGCFEILDRQALTRHALPA